MEFQNPPPTKILKHENVLDEVNKSHYVHLLKMTSHQKFIVVKPIYAQ